MSDPIAQYAFLSWARRGIGARIDVADPLGPSNPARPLRASVAVSLDINTSSRVDRTIELHGPGDVGGFDGRAVVRTDPRPNVSDFEPNYLASIELYDEDLPWRYTPARATAEHRLRPWIALVVLADGEFARPAARTITVPDASALFPPATQAWAWAHVHVNDPLSGGTGTLDSVVSANPDLALARIVCPRRLSPNTAYTAFLVPTFESGRLAGLGLDFPAGLDGAEPAWGNGQDLFPVYFEWSFRTGAGGDFESLVRLLEPRLLDPRVGIRDLDVSSPAPGLLDGINNPAHLGLEGALRTPQTTSTVWPRTEETFPTRLAALVNEGAMAGTDPIVTPTFYGHWHAATPQMLAAGNPPWIDELNADPRYRSAAAFGTDVIGRNQDQLAASAWQQLGDAAAANRLLVLAQLARFTVQSLHDRHIAPLGDDQLFAITAPLHRRVLAGTATVRNTLRANAVPTALVDRGFRRLARPRGPLARRVYGAVRPVRLLAKLNTGTLTAAPRVPDPSRALLVSAIDQQIRVVARVRDLHIGDVTVATIHQIPGRPDFAISKPGSAVSVPTTPGADSPQAARFRQALLAVHADLSAATDPSPTPPPLPVPSTRAALAGTIDPAHSIARRILPRVRVATIDIAGRPDPLATIMWAPRFDQPMYAPLAAISSELLLPNVSLVPQNTVSLLETNSRFVESYLVGLNHQMARELLWREFPTDQRGTYFRQFWDTRDAAGAAPRFDIDEIHTWPRTSDLGSHAAFGDDRLVLMIRGDLLKKYPTAIIYAVQASWPANGGKRELTTVEKYPLFRASIDPDLSFLGFDLQLEDARGSDVPADNRPGWFFVIKQRPGEPRFGLDVASPVAATAGTWDDLSWSNVADGPWIDVTESLRDATIPDQARWGATSADMASILYQDPVLIAIHATEMLR